MAGKSKQDKTNKAVWKQYKEKYLSWTKWTLLQQFSFFIVISFLLFYVIYISYLIPFTLDIFTQSNLNFIKYQYSDLNQQRQLQMSINLAASLNFFMVSANKTLEKMNTILSDMFTVPQHPLNWTIE